MSLKPEEADLSCYSGGDGSELGRTKLQQLCEQSPGLSSELRLPEFAGCSGTAQFIVAIDGYEHHHCCKIVPKVHEYCDLSNFHVMPCTRISIVNPMLEELKNMVNLHLIQRTPSQAISFQSGY